jgi:predicted NAD/FAD-binding protein
VTFSVSANFGAIAAITHIAPTAAVILAAIHEEPAAIVPFALMNFCDKIGLDQEFRG